MLLALAHAGRALGRPDLFAVADALGDALEGSWRMPHGGYFEGEIAVCPPYRQNPHMHLLESFMACTRRAARRAGGGTPNMLRASAPARS